MKTKLTLTILGTYNTIVGIMMIAIPSSMAAMMVNSDNCLLYTSDAADEP